MGRFFKILAGAGTVMAAVAIVLAIVVPAETIAATWNQWTLYVRKPATFGGYTTGVPEELGQVTIETDSASRKGLIVKLAASQTADALEILDSAGTTIFKVDNTGAVTFSSSVTLDAATEDPCTASPFGVGSVFWNTTSGYLCYCDGSSADLKVSDESTACF